MLLPGAGFDVVPTDCVAALLAAALPGADRLDLAFVVGGGPSPGTARTTIEGMGKGSRARIDGMITEVPVGWRTIRADFPSGPRTVASIPWGDVSTAYYSTGIGTITTYTASRGGDAGGRAARPRTADAAGPGPAGWPWGWRAARARAEDERRARTRFRSLGAGQRR